jgi:anti-anti-sigma regulatory factor
MTVTTIPLADLVGPAARERLLSVLSPSTNVVVSCQDAARLPVATVALMLTAVPSTGGFLRLEGLTPVTRLAVQVVDPERRLALDDAARTPQVGERPYQVHLHEDGSVRVLLLKGIGQHRHMTEAASHEWVRGLDAQRVEVDLRHIEHLNSLLVAWLLQLNQGAGAGRCRLVQVGRQAVAQLTQLRLNHLLAIA